MGASWVSTEGRGRVSPVTMTLGQGLAACLLFGTSACSPSSFTHALRKDTERASPHRTVGVSGFRLLRAHSETICKVKGLEEAARGSLMEEHRRPMTRTDHCTDYSRHSPGGTLAPEPRLSVPSASLTGLKGDSVHTPPVWGAGEDIFPF